MHGTHSYNDIGVSMVDCAIVIAYTLHVCGPLRTSAVFIASTLGYQEKPIGTICFLNLMVECNMNIHIIYILVFCCSMHAYRTIAPYTVQITHNLNSTHVSHVCDTRGVNHTRVGFLGSTRMHKHTQYLHICVYIHTVFTLACVLHVCMLVWLM